MYALLAARLFRSGLVALCLAVLAMAAPAAAREHQAADVAGILAALRVAQGGDIIRLAPGDYAPFQLAPRTRVPIRFDPPVTLTSADPARPAVLTGLDVREARGLIFTGLVFDYRFTQGDPVNKRPFAFRASEDITVRGVLIDGDLARGVSPEEDGLGAAFGLSFRGGARITVEDTEVRRFFRGMVFGGIDDLMVRDNELHSLRLDGMNFVAIQRALIEGNRIHSFRRSTLRRDHADMIQFWTNGSTRPSTDITIRGNLLMSGHGGQTQTIFMRNEEVDSGRAGDEMFYRNITIEENLIVNGHVHGITLGEADGVVIRRNTLLRNHRAAQGDQRDRQLRIPRLNLAEASRNVVIEDNIGPVFPAARPGWQVAGNLIAQDRTATAAGFYHTLFEAAQTGDPAAVDSYAIRPGSAADRPGLGAPILHRAPTGLRLQALGSD